MAISIPDLEQRAALGWRAPEEERVGDWLLRAAGGFTGRANSALAVGDPRRPLGQAADAVRGWYHARGLPAMIAISYPAAGPQADPVDRFLAGRGWGVRSGTATVMTAPAGQIARAAGPVPAARSRSTPSPTRPGWPCTTTAASRGCRRSPGRVTTLLFDVLGTVVDEAGSVAAETARALAGAVSPLPDQVAAEWTRRVEALMGVTGSVPRRTPAP